MINRVISDYKTDIVSLKSCRLGVRRLNRSLRQLTRQLDVFGFLGGCHGILEDLCRADDDVGILHHPAEEVLLLAVPADGHQVVVAAQVRLELVLVMLFYEMDLGNRGNNSFIWPVLLCCPSSLKICVPLTMLTRMTTLPLAVASRCFLATYTAARVFPDPVGNQMMMFSPFSGRWTTSSW